MRLNRHPQDILVSRLYAANQDRHGRSFSTSRETDLVARFCGAVSDDGTRIRAQNIFRDDSTVRGAFVNGQLRELLNCAASFVLELNDGSRACVEPDSGRISVCAVCGRMFNGPENQRLN
jgi:hypothetical protein